MRPRGEPAGALSRHVGLTGAAADSGTIARPESETTTGRYVSDLAK